MSERLWLLHMSSPLKSGSGRDDSDDSGCIARPQGGQICCVCVVATQRAPDSNRGWLPGYVVSDSSTDDSFAGAEALKGELPLTLPNHKANLGLARAFDTGLRAATADARADDFIVTMEADGTNQPAVVAAMATKVREGCEVVCASRYQEGGGYAHFPWKRRIFGAGAN